MPSCACIPPDGEDWSRRWIRECEYHAAMRAENERLGAEVKRLTTADAFSRKELRRGYEIIDGLRAEVERMINADAFSRKELRRVNKIIDGLRAAVERYRAALEKYRGQIDNEGKHSAATALRGGEG